MDRLSAHCRDVNKWFENNADVRKDLFDMISEETECIHRELSAELQGFSKCDHVQFSHSGNVLFPCTLCSTTLDANRKKVSIRTK